MDCEELLREALVKFGSCHVMGSESQIFADGMKNLNKVIQAIERAKKEEDKHADRADRIEQRKDV